MKNLWQEERFCTWQHQCVWNCKGRDDCGSLSLFFRYSLSITCQSISIYLYDDNHADDGSIHVSTCMSISLGWDKWQQIVGFSKIWVWWIIAAFLVFDPLTQHTSHRYKRPSHTHTLNKTKRNKMYHNILYMVVVVNILYRIYQINYIPITDILNAIFWRILDTWSFSMIGTLGQECSGLCRPDASLLLGYDHYIYINDDVFNTNAPTFPWEFWIAGNLYLLILLFFMASRSIVFISKIFVF